MGKMLPTWLDIGLLVLLGILALAAIPQLLLGVVALGQAGGSPVSLGRLLGVLTFCLLIALGSRWLWRDMHQSK